MGAMPIRPGVTVPLAGHLHTHRERLHELVALGYSDIWSAEVDGADGFTPLALAAAWEPGLRLGTAIIPAYTRAPALLAQSVASLADAAPGRFAIGIGSSSNVIVERWNGVPFERPYQRVRDVVRFLRAALTGEKVTERYDSFEVQGFRLGLVPEQQPPILVAGLREGMLRLAGREGDGAIINWLSANDVQRVTDVVHGAADGASREIVCRLFVCPSDNTDVVRAAGRRTIASYLNVPVYAAFHTWLGRGPQLQGMWDAWQAGDRKAALAAIPDEVVDDLIVHGTPAQCRARIDEYIANGVTTTSLTVMALDPDLDPWQAVRDLSPSAAAGELGRCPGGVRPHRGAADEARCWAGAPAIRHAGGPPAPAAGGGSRRRARARCDGCARTGGTAAGPSRRGPTRRAGRAARVRWIVALTSCHQHREGVSQSFPTLAEWPV